MRFSLFSLLAVFMLFACSQKQVQEAEVLEEIEGPAFVELKKFHEILEQADLLGAILIYDEKQGQFFGNDSLYSSKGYLPASTFKIPNTLVSLGAGVSKDENSIFKWDGEPKYLEAWEQDLSLAKAFEYSCLPCYQESARKTGLEKMRRILSQIEYPGMIYDQESLDVFWVAGESRISPFEQIAFLRRLFHGEVDAPEQHIDILKKIMRVKHDNAYVLQAKTGWSIEGERNRGWYVGRFEKGDKIYFFATHVEPKDQANTEGFGPKRISVSLEALEFLAGE